MRRVGTVVRTAQGLAIVRTTEEDPPSMGTPLVDENLDEIGQVVSVFGPVERPYVAVDPTEGHAPATMLDRPLYAR